MNPILVAIASKITKGRVLLVLAVVVILGLFYWLSTHSFIEVSVNSSEAGDYTYQILSQSSLKSSVDKNGTGSVKKLVRKGSYEVLAVQGSKSYFAVAAAKGFLGTAKVSGDLHAENARRFIGNNPGSCMNLIGQTLVSSACNSLVSDLGVHVPATDSQATYVKKITAGAYGGYLDSVFNTKEGGLMLAKTIGSNDFEDQPHFIYALDPSFSITKKTDLPGLDANKSYLTKSYKTGFIVYEAGLSQVVYYPTVGASPTNLPIDKPQTSGLLPVSLAVQGDKITLLYAHGTEAKDKNPASEVITWDGKKSTHQKFTKQNSIAANTCGDNRLCLVGNKRLDIYNTGSAKPALLYSITGVLGIENFGNSLLVIREKDMLSLDLERRAGFIGYSLGDYAFSSLQVAGGNYVLSLTKPNQKTVALYIDQSTPDTDSIDKKLLDIEKIVGVTAVSIYDKHIFISPNGGPLVYASGGYGYDPAILKAANTRINQGLDKIGINKTVYKVISTL